MMPNTNRDAIPLRQFGRHNVRISALGFGGHHLGDAPDEPTAVRLVRQAVDGGITFFDNCWEYHRGKAEDWMGAGLKGVRDRVFLMTKVCTHGRDKALALRMLDESLHRLRTDHLDLWQIHGVCFENDPALFIRKDGAAEALEQAKKEGKVRFVGFTGHKDPSIHLKMLATGFPFDSVQMPLNVFDAHFHSFEQQVLPELNRRGIAALGMKAICGHGDPVQGKVRFLGFTGHKDPSIHLEMRSHNFPFDTVQMPLNCLDATFRNFETSVLPAVNRRRIAALGMKSLGGSGEMVREGAVVVTMGLRYAMSLPVAVTVS